MTRKTLEKLPDKVREQIERIKAAYKEDERYASREIVRARLAAYVQALQDAGIITDRERMTLYIYGTM